MCVWHLANPGVCHARSIVLIFRCALPTDLELLFRMLSSTLPHSGSHVNIASWLSLPWVPRCVSSHHACTLSVLLPFADHSCSSMKQSTVANRRSSFTHANCPWEKLGFFWAWCLACPGWHVECILAVLYCPLYIVVSGVFRNPLPLAIQFLGQQLYSVQPVSEDNRCVQETKAGVASARWLSSAHPSWDCMVNTSY